MTPKFITVVVPVLAVAGVALMVAWSAERGPVPVIAAVERQLGDWPKREGTGILVAGSGTGLPLMYSLADSFRNEFAAVQLEVASSIGSRGGLLALAAGAIDIALVSRPLDQSTRNRLQAVLCARVAVILAASKYTPDNALSEQKILDALRGKDVRWSDGQRLIPLLREASDTGQQMLSAGWPRFGAALVAAWHSKRFDVLFSDAAMQHNLLVRPGTFGVFDSGAITAQTLPLKEIHVAPSSSVRGGDTASVLRPLYLVTRRTPHKPFVEEFLHYCQSGRGRQVVSAAGYQAVP